MQNRNYFISISILFALFLLLRSSAETAWSSGIDSTIKHELKQGEIQSYPVELSRGLEIKLRFIDPHHRNSIFEVAMYDSEGKQIGKIIKGKSKTEHETIQVITPGTYRFDIHSLEIASVTYKLELNDMKEARLENGRRVCKNVTLFSIIFE
jgi:hypothetical protein